MIFFPLSFWREATHTGHDSWFSSSGELIYLFLLLYYNKILTFPKHRLLDSSSYLLLLCVRCMALKVKAQVLWSSIVISQCHLDSLALCLHYDFCFWGFLTYQFSNSLENIFKIFSISFFQKEDCSRYLVCQVAGNERLSWFLNNFFFSWLSISLIFLIHLLFSAFLLDPLFLLISQRSMSHCILSFTLF